MMIFMRGLSTLDHGLKCWADPKPQRIRQRWDTVCERYQETTRGPILARIRVASCVLVRPKTDIIIQRGLTYYCGTGTSSEWLVGIPKRPSVAQRRSLHVHTQGKQSQELLKRIVPCSTHCPPKRAAQYPLATFPYLCYTLTSRDRALDWGYVGQTAKEGLPDAVHQISKDQITSRHLVPCLTSFSSKSHFTLTGVQPGSEVEILISWTLGFSQITAPRNDVHVGFLCLLVPGLCDPAIFSYSFPCKSSFGTACHVATGRPVACSSVGSLSQ